LLTLFAGAEDPPFIPFAIIYIFQIKNIE